MLIAVRCILPPDRPRVAVAVCGIEQNEDVVIDDEGVGLGFEI